jgi:hypothetical protein
MRVSGLTIGQTRAKPLRRWQVGTAWDWTLESC